MRKIVCLAFSILATMGTMAQKPQMFSTTESNRWVKNKVSVENHQNAKGENIVVYTDSLVREVEGFGGTFSERAWDAMQCVNEQQRMGIMKEMFGEEGIHFAWGRTPVGGNDLSLSTYTYNDVDYDWTQRNFSIARDRYILLPMIKLAKKVRPDLKMWASPWTPPYWMKISEHYSLKSHGINHTDVGHNRMDEHFATYPNITTFKMTDGCLRSYAIYLSKYLQAYKQEGVNIDILMPQNEVQWQPCWQCCTWRPQDFAIFIEKYLVPQLETDKVKDTELWLGTINYPNPQWVFDFFKDNGVAKYIKGIGMQWTGMRAMPKVHEQMPGMKLMQTEGICGDGDNNWADMVKSWERILHCFRSGASSYMQWNMVLGDDLESLFKWKQNALVIINRKTGALTRTPEYYLMKHFSHFIQPGSQLLKVSNDTNTIAFKNQDGKVVVVCYNPEKKANTMSFTVEGKDLTATLAPLSLNTIVY